MFKNFLQKISRTKNVSFKVYGQLDAVQETQFKRYYQLLKKFIDEFAYMDIHVISVYFRKCNDRVECEVKFITGTSFESSMHNNEVLSKNVRVFKDLLRKNNSDLILKTAFRSDGEVTSSSLQFTF